MGLADLTRDSVLAAITEFDQLGRERFLGVHGFGPARSYYLAHEGRLYDSKAIAGVAHGYARPDLGPLDRLEFSGGAATVEARLSDLGFEMALPSGSDDGWGLDPGDVIKRTNLHDQYGGSRQGGISPSRDTRNVLLFSDRSVGEKHGYLDRWDRTTLHYTGEGQHGNQQMTHGNKAIRDHVDHGRALRVFEGSSGDVTYVGEFALDPARPWYLDRAPETNGGPMRDVIMFRLVPIGRIQSEGRELEPKEVRPSLQAPYVPVPENPEAAPQEIYTVDPDVVDRGRQGHRRTQNELADWAQRNGLHPIRPVAGDPPFDVGWWSGETFSVVEVKSLTRSNEIHQLRIGLGQVLDYAHQLRHASISPRPILAVEVAPTNTRWREVCEEAGVALVWPSTFDSLLANTGPLST